MHPRARLIRLLGEELISDEPVALVELVKNAYDADATFAEVIFTGDDPSHPENIIVQDDGHGMDVATVLGAWFEPGAITKKLTRLSPGSRIYQGAKGIGRFAAARLGGTLLLESVPRNEGTGVLVLTNWGAFDDSSYLEDVEIEYETMEKAGFGTGTRLTIGDVRKEWTQGDYVELRSRLGRLVSPFNEILDFEIRLEIPGYPELSGRVEPPELLLAPLYRLTGGLDVEGLFSGELAAGGTQEVIDKRRIATRDLAPSCGPFSVDIRAWDRDTASLKPLAERLGIGIQKMRTTLNEFCGVSIYRDGFRVYPYGQAGDDWLRLDNRSRQNPTRSLANNQIVAAIRISSDVNKDLVDRSTREGLVHNREFEDLDDWFKKILTIIEEKRYALKPREAEDAPAQPLFEGFCLEEERSQAAAMLGSNHRVVIMLDEAEKRMRRETCRVQEVYSRLLMLSGLGQMVDQVIHEIGAPLGKINRGLAALEKRMLECLGKHDPAREIQEVARAKEDWPDRFDRIKAWSAEIHGLRERLDPQTPAKRGRTTSFDVRDELRETLGLFDSLIQKQGISLDVPDPGVPVQVRMSRSVLGQVLSNLIDNSIYWIRDEKGNEKGGHLQIRLEDIENGFRIMVADDGPGVPEEDVKRIFDSYYTTKENGMGLGLYIASLVIEPYGRLLYRTDGPLPGACFEARFERSVGR